MISSLVRPASLVVDENLETRAEVMQRAYIFNDSGGECNRCGGKKVKVRGGGEELAWFRPPNR